MVGGWGCVWCKSIRHQLFDGQDIVLAISTTQLLHIAKCAGQSKMATPPANATPPEHDKAT